MARSERLRLVAVTADDPIDLPPAPKLRSVEGLKGAELFRAVGEQRQAQLDAEYKTLDERSAGRTSAFVGRLQRSKVRPSERVLGRIETAVFDGAVCEAALASDALAARARKLSGVERVSGTLDLDATRIMAPVKLQGPPVSHDAPTEVIHFVHGGNMLNDPNSNLA